MNEPQKAKVMKSSNRPGYWEVWFPEATHPVVSVCFEHCMALVDAEIWFRREVMQVAQPQ